MVAKLAEALRRIHRVDKHIGETVTSFTLSLVVRNDPRQPSRFTSGSTGQYVGRTCLTNVLAPGVDLAVLADALVHESIHSVLYMQEKMAPWVTDADVYSGVGYGAVSPWSGRTLTPRQFMQACFVWFGLYKFWTMPGAVKEFGNERAAAMAWDARKGFYRSDLVGLTSSWRHLTDPILIDCIYAMQKMVMKSDYPALVEGIRERRA
ncbi:HEXXH motif-containing putative peptide modification protein [Pseudoxanthomonas sp. SL93]|uniref:aKG-HExxH-type peptide beta-hydroxylase n=1 Tax=Pseudoxanthomonas sp. SL93 TaxID=2995142 RepID=UPI00226F4B6E|nr:HEXXH motif-containing putative peptide modification protein [Pseudoxanthomonas sp. SL93]WAC62090.1 HEXXH motif-containing putative peptide modification protein [Pseudoxanthomonas sp. SL93]